MKKFGIQKITALGQIPSPRFGHTFTMVSPTKAVLFGGAVSLAGKFVITNETYLYDFLTTKWTKINFKNDFVPSERAAHAAVMVSEMQMIIYGGSASGTQGPLKDQLYILDLRKDPVWKIIEVSNKNVTPGQRYGHTMLFNKPYLVVFAGNSGIKAQNDVWLLNILKGPFTWQKYEFQNKIVPSPRVYHSAAICEEGFAQGMMVVFGGRKQTKKDHNGSQKQLAVAALNDIWGLRRHRNGSWDWVTPPQSQSYTPICRYQHLVCFMGTTLVIVGGRSNNPDEAVSAIQLYDIEKAEWQKVGCISRYRHAIAVYNKTKLFVHGGFQPELASQPLESMISIDFARESQQTNRIGHENQQNQKQVKQTVEPSSKFQKNKKQLRQLNESERNIQINQGGSESNNRTSRIKSALGKSKLERELTPSRVINTQKNIRLSNQVIIAHGESNNIQIQKVHVNTLLEESKKLTEKMDQHSGQDAAIKDFIQSVLNTLMPQTNRAMTSHLFPLKKQKIIKLCQESSKIVIKQCSLVGVRTPVKIFGSIYGRYHDLLKIFEAFGSPDDREMESSEYVFLGNYVGKGFNSLETICLLMALKIRYHEHITLLRGRQEDVNVNRMSGLAEECSIRLGENIQDPNSCFMAINNFFNCLPLAALVEEQFLCIHSGLGSISNLTQIRDVVRPLKVQDNQIVTSLLWSNDKSCKILKYEVPSCSDEQVQQFLSQNGVEMLINTKDGLSNGVEDNRHTISVFSVTNYAHSKNKAGILKVKKDMGLVPYLLNSSPTKRGSWVDQISTKTALTFNSLESQYRNQMFQF